MNNQKEKEITFYLRTAKKLGFIQKSKNAILSCSEIKQMAAKRCKIPVDKQVIFYNGKRIDQNQNIKIIDKAIVHVVDSRNLVRNKMRVNVKRLSQSSINESFEVDSNSSIDKFIKQELSGHYQEPAEKLFLVYSGRQLKRSKSFIEQHVQHQTQLICVHQQKDKKSNKKSQTEKKQLEKIKLRATQRKEKSQINKVDQIKQNSFKVLNKQVQESKFTKNQSEDQKSPKNNIQDRNSQTSQIQECKSVLKGPDFKKKNKIQSFDSIQNEKDQRKEEKQKQHFIYKTKEEIFQSNRPTYQSVIDGPQDSFSMQAQKNVHKLSELSLQNQFQASNTNHQQQIFDSGMNFDKENDSKLQVKQSKGFMNFSNASLLLQNKKAQELQQNEKIKQNLNEKRDNNSSIKIEDNKSNQMYSELEYSYSRAIQTRGNGNDEIQSYDTQKQQENQQHEKQKQIMGNQENDNLFIQVLRGVPAQQQNRNDQGEGRNIVQESNLLDDPEILHHNNDYMMNNFMFNLTQNHDQVSSEPKQGVLNAGVGEQQNNINSSLGSEQEADQQNLSEMQVMDSKRHSQIETNFKESAGPSQVESHTSHNHFESNQNLDQIQNKCSLIDNLITTQVQNQKQNQLVRSKNSQKQNITQLQQNQNQQNLRNFSNFVQKEHVDLQSEVKQFQQNEQANEFVQQQQNQKQNEEKFQYFHGFRNQHENSYFNNIHPVQKDPYEVTFRKRQFLRKSQFSDCQNGSRLIHQLSLLSNQQSSKPQLLPGDIIYSTDPIETPDQILQHILQQFSHCF